MWKDTNLSMEAVGNTFSVRCLKNGIAHDEMTEAMHNFKKKFKVESKKEYIDLNDFAWFSLYNKK